MSWLQKSTEAESGGGLCNLRKQNARHLHRKEARIENVRETVLRLVGVVPALPRKSALGHPLPIPRLSNLLPACQSEEAGRGSAGGGGPFRRLVSNF